MVLKGLLNEQHDEHHGKQLGEVLDHRLPRCPPQLRLLCQLQSRCPPVGSGPPLLGEGVLFPPRIGWEWARELDSLSEASIVTLTFMCLLLHIVVCTRC